MFFVGLTKRMKSYLMNFPCMFASFYLPLLVVVLFAVTIPDAEYQNFSSIPVSIIGESDEYRGLYCAMQDAKSSTGEKLFRVSLCTEVIAKEKLTSGDSVAYIRVEHGVHITAMSKGQKVDVIQSYVDWLTSVNGKRILNMDMQYSIDKCAEEDFNKNEIYFLSMLAFTSIFSLYLGVRMFLDMDGTFPAGMRIGICPVSKIMIAIQNLLAAFFISFLGNAILILVIDRLTNMELMPHFSYVIIALALNSLIGILLGLLIGICNMESYTITLRLCNVLLLILGFLAGIFKFKMRYSINENIPVIAFINPVNITTDALYCLYFTGEMEQYLKNLLILLSICVVLTIGNVVLARRKKHVYL